MNIIDISMTNITKAQDAGQQPERLNGRIPVAVGLPLYLDMLPAGQPQVKPMRP